jgi:hypothetical protein
MWTAGYLNKMTFVTIIFFFVLAIKGGEVFASFAGVLHQGVGFIVKKSGFAEWMCRMTKGFLAPQTCTSKDTVKNAHRNIPPNSIFKDRAVTPQ